MARSPGPSRETAAAKCAAAGAAETDGDGEGPAESAVAWLSRRPPRRRGACPARAVGPPAEGPTARATMSVTTIERAGKGKHGSGAHGHASSQRHSFSRPPYCSTGLAFGKGATPKRVARQAGTW